jgi:hypothetical protein
MGLLDSGNSTVRNEWQILMSSIDILEAARNKLAYHQSRLRVWEDAKVVAEDKLKKEGLISDTSVYSNSGRQESVALNQLPVKDFKETISKIDEHKGKIRDYGSWVEFLKRSSGNLPLRLIDYLYFFGK